MPELRRERDGPVTRVRVRGGITMTKTREQELVLALEVLTQGAEAVLPQVLREQSFLKAATRTEQATRAWTVGRGVQGLGVGEKITDGRATRELALRVYVAKKQPLAKIRHPVPKVATVPEVGKVPTDVLEIGRVQLESFTERVRPAMPGCGVGHPKVTVGTFGLLVRKKGKAKNLYVLSSSHVLANEGLGKAGDAALQPGQFDDGKAPGDVIGELAEFVPFEFTGTGYPNQVDAALAKVISAKEVTKEIRLLGRPSGVNPTVSRGMQVQKVGRTTDYTVGVIQDIHYRLALEYLRLDAPGKRGRVGLRDQVLCTRYTDGGDSGSAVLDMEKKVVGLHFAGSPSTSIFNRIEHVLTLLKIELA